jgi:hypothetical protein
VDWVHDARQVEKDMHFELVGKRGYAKRHNYFPQSSVTDLDG